MPESRIVLRILHWDIDRILCEMWTRDVTNQKCNSRQVELGERKKAFMRNLGPTRYRLRNQCINFFVRGLLFFLRCHKMLVSNKKKPPQKL